MSQEIVNAINDLFDAMNRGDIEAVLERVHPEGVWEPNKQFPIAAGDRYVGHEGIRRWYQEWFVDPWDEVTVTPEDILDAGNDRYVWTAHVVGRGKASGIEVDMRIYDVVTFRNGLGIHRESFMDRDEALEAAGLSE